MVKSCRNKVGQQTGGRKLYDHLKNDLEKHNIKIGRDKFFNVLRAHRMLVRKTKQYHITTNSKHQFYKYKNLVKNKIPTRPEQLWVSDITYIKTQNGQNYLALITGCFFIDAINNTGFGLKRKVCVYLLSR